MQILEIYAFKSMLNKKDNIKGFFKDKAQ